MVEPAAKTAWLAVALKGDWTMFPSPWGLMETFLDKVMMGIKH
jgi:hypothetical protein